MVRYSSRTIGFLFGALGALTFGGLQISSIFRSTSSTASIGLIFVPIWCLLAFALFFAFGYGIGYIRNQLAKDKKNINFKTVATIFFILAFGGYLGKEVMAYFFVMNAVSKVEQTEDNDNLVLIFNESFMGRNKFVLGALAQKRTVSPELLDRIARLKDPDLYEAMGSLLPVLGKNGKGLAVMRLVVENPNVSTETVEYLAANTKQEYVLSTIAGSSKTSEATLKKLEQEKNYLVDWGLAQNQNLPQDVFTRLLDRKKDFTQRTTLEMILRNPSVSTDIQNKARELLAVYN